MKKTLAFILTVVMLLGCVPSMVIAAENTTVSTYTGTPDTSWYTAEVETAKTFTITTADQFAGLAVLVNEQQKTFADIELKLGADLVFNTGNASDWEATAPTHTWTPIGMGTYFYGNLNGQGHTISGLYFNDSGKDFAGVFAVVSGSTIENLQVKNCYFGGKAASGGVVACVKLLSASFRNIYCDAIVKAANNYAGGIVATLDIGGCDFTNILFTGSTWAGNQYSAGIAAWFKGQNGNTFKNCVTYGTHGAKKKAGGIFGLIQENDDITVENCISAANVYITGTDSKGNLLSECGMMTAAMYAASGKFTVNVKDFVYATGETYPDRLVKDVNTAEGGSYTYVTFKYTQTNAEGIAETVEAPLGVAADSLKGANVLSALTPAFKNWYVTTEGYAMPKGLAIALGYVEQAPIRAVTAQVSKGSSDMDIRFVATLDKMDYEEIGFEISYTLPEATSATVVKQSVHDVYAELYGSTASFDILTRSASYYGANYLYTYTVEDLPVTGTITFTVKPYTKAANAEAVFGEGYEVTYTDGVFVVAAALS